NRRPCSPAQEHCIVCTTQRPDDLFLCSPPDLILTSPFCHWLTHPRPIDRKQIQAEHAKINVLNSAAECLSIQPLQCHLLNQYLYLTFLYEMGSYSLHA